VGALAEIRELNRLRLLEELRRVAVADRAELARLTGLSRATVSALVSDFLASGALTEAPDPAGTGTPGRPSSLLRLNPRAGVVLGVDFGHRHVRVAVADLAASVLAERRVDLELRAGALAALDVTADLARTLLSEAGVARERVLGAGMGVPAPVDSGEGIVTAAAVLVEWEGIRPGEELRKRLGMPVRVANDADLGALAEHVYGAGRGFDDLLYLKLATGIGAGLVLGGRLHSGATGIAGEIGHLCVDPNGVVCVCGGRGCLAGVASAHALGRSHGGGLTVMQLLKLAEAGDEEALARLARAGRLVGDALGGLCTALNPAAIVLGGELGPALREAVEARVRESSLAPTGEIPVLAATLGDRAGVLGAITLALQATEWLRDAGFIALTEAA